MIKKSEIFAKVNAPALRLEDGQQVPERSPAAKPVFAKQKLLKAGDILLNFYEDLGWNPETHTLDPVKIKTTKEIYNALYDAIYAVVPDSLGVGMLLVNRGPSVTENIKPETVYLLNGWIKEDES